MTDYSLIIRYNHLKSITEAYLEFFFTILNIIKYLIYILIAIAIVIFIFLKVSPAFGGTPDKDALKTIENSQNFFEGKFQNIKTNYSNFRSSEKKATFKDWFSPPKDKNPLKPIPTIKFKGKDFKDTICNHPFFDLGFDYDIPMLQARFVTTEQGTGIVHCAPSHGPDDFNLCINNGIKAIETVDGDGKYTENVTLFEGVHIV